MSRPMFSWGGTHSWKSAGMTPTISLTVLIDADFSAPLINTVVVSSTTSGDDLDNNSVGVYIKSYMNFVFDNHIDGSVQGVYLTARARANQIVQNEFRHNKVGIYLKTEPDDFIWDNLFEDNTNNLQVAPEWRMVLPEQVASR